MKLITLTDRVMTFVFTFAITLSLCSQTVFGVLTKDYCSNTLCSGLRHTACGNKEEFGHQCYPDTTVIDITPLKKLIVDRHNRHRNRTAGGHLPGFSSAVRMATMTWDDELGYLAYLNAIRCDMQHDACRNTERFRNSGQSLAWRWDPLDSVPRARESFIWAIDYWFSEYLDSNMGQINRFYAGHNAEHFTVMAGERNVAVGCACVKQNEGDGINIYVVCNYATTNVVDRPVYRRGPIASHCKTGRNTHFTNLCSPDEVYDVNSYRW